MGTTNYHLFTLCCTTILVLYLLPQVPVEAIIKPHLGCSKIYSGSGGEIQSPDYPQEYPNNLVCTWAIKASPLSRIRIKFNEFRLEKSEDCFDRLVVKDGIQPDSMIIGTYCGSDTHGLTLTSSGNTMLLNFITDASFGERGIKLTWESIDKITLKTPTDGVFSGSWSGLEAPTKIISFEAGFKKGTVWALDENNDIYFYDGKTWDIYPGKLRSITVGESGIFGIHPMNQSIYQRYGATLQNPKGYRWEFLSPNQRKVVQLESSGSGILYGLDSRDNLLYASGGSFKSLDSKWKSVPLDLENGGRIDEPLNGISCGLYSCFVTTKSGDVYGMTTPGDPAKAKWIHDFGNFANVTVGFGNNIWALNGKGNIYKKASVNNIHMMGKEWIKQYGLNAKQIVAGLMGVYVLTQDGSLGYVKDAICGGFLFKSTGVISSPNYPSNYPPNLSCLWVVRAQGAKVIDLNFDTKFDIKASPLCKDQLTTTYPGITEPIVECGKTVVDKRIQAEQVWIEFVTDDKDEGSGFQINYQSIDPSRKTTNPPPVTKRVQSLPKGWAVFKPDKFFEKQFGVKSIVPYRKDIMWGLTRKGQAFMRTPGTTNLIPGNGLKSLATNGRDIWAIDGSNNLVLRTGISGIKPGGDTWKVVVPYTLYKKLYSGPAGHFIVLNDNDELQHCIIEEKSKQQCQRIARNVKTSASSAHGTWFIDNNNNLFFSRYVKKPDNTFDFTIKNLRTKVKDVQVTKTGDVWALYLNNTLTLRKGVSTFKPEGLKWENTKVVGEKMHTTYDNIHVVLKDGTRTITLKDPVKPLPDGWTKMKTNVNSPYRIDAYPNETWLDVWVLGGLNGRVPYQGVYRLDADRDIAFQRRGDTELRSISVGESGVWGINYKDQKAMFYNPATKKWLSVPNDDKKWDVIESASPLNNVYAISYEYSELYFREGISTDNPLGTKWVNTGLSTTQVSSGSYITYFVTDDGGLKSFSVPPTTATLKTWLGSLKSYLNEVENTFSVGFGGVVVFLDPDNDVVERNILLPKDEVDDRKWVWRLNRDVGASDISAGPVIFGIVGENIIAKKVTSCFGRYHDKPSPIIVQLSKRNPNIGKCTWVITTPYPTTINAILTKHNFPVSERCSSGGLFYSTNHQSPVLGEFKEHCGNSEFREVIKGNRMLFQYVKSSPLPTDELEMRFDVVKKDPGCGGTFTKEQGRIISPKYPKNYPNSQDCISIIKVPRGKIIQLTIEKMDIEYGGNACDYDYLQINDGEYTTDSSLGKFCGKKTNLVLRTSSNVVRILFKSDDSGNAPGFQLSWRTVGVQRATTAKPVGPTIYTDCGGRFNKNEGRFTSPNWPSNYPKNQDCKWYITVDPSEKVTLTLTEFDLEGDQGCLYDYLIVYDGLVPSSNYLGKLCGKKTKYQVQSSRNKMLVVFHSDSSTMNKGFIANWDTKTPVPTKPAVTAQQTTPATVIKKPDNWDRIHPGYKFNKLKSDYKGVIWGIKADDKKIYTIDKDGTPPTLLTNLFNVYALSLGKYSVQKNGAWALAGPDREIYFFNISKYDKEPWVKVRSIDGSKNADIVTTLFNTYLVKEDGHIFYRQGITESNPIGEQWYLYERGNGITESIFGTWLINRDGNLQFKRFGSRVFTTVNKPYNDKPYTQIVTGFGNKVYAVINRELFVREGVSFNNPSGTTWKATGVSGVRDVSVNNFGVFVLLNDDKMIKLDDVACGGILTPLSGRITYPEFQNTYSSRQYCMWYLKLDGVDQILINQLRFELENSQGCTKDRVTFAIAQNIQSGMEVSSHCDTGLPNKKLVLNGDKAFVEFLSDDDVNKRGFSFEYSGKKHEGTRACGGVFQSDIGRIQSERYPREYKPNSVCEWKITTRENTNILIVFDDMNIKAGPECGKSDYLQIYDGSSSDSGSILKTYCDENGPQSVRSSGNKVFIRFLSDGSKSGRGFSGNWRAEPIMPGKLGCGDTFTMPSGSIKSPNFPDKYDNYADCSYLIRLTPGKKIMLRFARFSVEKSTSCDRDYVKIYNVNENGLRTLAKTLCGSDSIPDFESDGNRVDIVFKSDGTSPYSGFDIRYMDTELLKNPVYPSGWKEVSSPDKVFVQIDAAVESSGAWAIDSKGYPYQFNPADKKWTVTDYLSDDLMSLTPGKYGVYALKQNGELYFRYGVTPQKLDGRYWQRIIPDNNLLSAVDYGAYGRLMGITKSGDVLSRSDIVPIHNPQGNKWHVVARGFKSISLGTYGYWLVDNGDNVFFAKYDPRSDFNERLTLTQINGKFKKVTAGFGGNVWALDGNNKVFMRLNVNFMNPSGTTWSPVADLLLSDIASGYDAVYGITLAGRVIRYSETYCGGLYSTPTGSFSSPNFPLYYPANSNCLYIIHVPGYNKITTDVVQFAVEDSSNCLKDYFLTSRDGEFPSQSPIRNCGRQKRDIPQVFGSKAWYEFVSDGNGQDVGFFVEWKATKEQVTKPVTQAPTAPPTTSDGLYRNCGGAITGTSGTIVHPNHPGNYRNNRVCRYALTVSPDKVVRIKFDKIDMEDSGACRYDYLEVTDSFNYQTKRYCRYGQHNDFISFGRSIIMIFKTDQAGTRSGFRIQWEAIDPKSVQKPATTAAPTPRVVTTLGTTEKIEVNRDCGKVYRDFSGYIYHPSYPMGYRNNLDCIWTVVMPRGDGISFEFQFFKLESSPNCENDFVAIYEGASDKSPLVKKFCGTSNPAAYKSKKNVASIRIKTNHKVTMNGFVVLFKRILSQVPVTETPREECGEDINGLNEGYITSPNYPSKYENNRDCFYTVTVYERKTIKVQFVDFDLEGSAQCSYDFVQLRSGGNVNSRSLGKFCGDRVPAVVRTSGNKLFIRFKSDGQNNFKGFKLYWKEVDAAQDCRYYYNSESGEIASPGYPNNYDFNKDCYWHITVPAGRKITVSFSDFELEKCQGDTGFDYVRTIDGETADGKQLGKYCGDNVPQPVRSSSNSMVIHFHSDDRLAKKGFRLTWKSESIKIPQKKLTTAKPTSEKTDCVFDVSGRSGFITHPNYPNDYEVNKDCKWRIRVSNGKRIQIRMREMQIETSENCEYDYIQLVDSLDNNAAQLAKFCGNNLPTPSTSSGNEMTVRFVSDDQYTKKGFKLEWREVPETGKPEEEGGCSKTLYSQYGKIKSSNYPNSYDLNKDCMWRIAAPLGNVIQIRFDDIDTEASLSGSCYDYVQIYDGSSKSANSLGKFCGRRIPGVLTSRGRYMLVRFYSDDRTAKKGFQLTYRAVKKGKSASTKCEKEIEAASNRNSLLRGAFTPRCRSDGFYEKSQCHGSTGYCWCVGIVTGREVVGTRKGPGQQKTNCRLSKCEGELIQSKKRGPMPGQFTPECQVNGDYSKKQCHGSTGHCWCVEETTGQELLGTRKGPGLGDPQCHLSACERQRQQKTGSFTPKCKVDGSYENKQCDASNGECWCVESKTGKQVAGTRRTRGQTPPNCGLSKCEREAAVDSTNPDVYVVKCKPDGSYYRKQCYDQRKSCWCVDPETGKEIEGTWRGPRDGTPKCGDEKKCNPACPYNYEPVCGSDGKSYSNKCLFKYAKCQEPTLALSYEGECRDSDNCKRACTFIYNPVCGSDGVSYSNPCTFKMKQCETPSLKYAYGGECTDTNVCQKACGFNYEPVCASDGKTYSNECVRKLAECQNPLIKLAYDGYCKDCLIVCPYNYEPVCGSNGKTFSNPCNLKNAQCKDSSITHVSNGECGAKKDKCDKACTKEYRPVCGSDKNTYSNLCLFQIAQCKDRSLTIAYNGRCSRLEDDCSRVFTAEKGSITHRNYPNNYLANQDCIYTIKSPFNTRIVFYFQKFDLEQSDKCRNDYISITDDENERSPKQYCGKGYPSIIRSTTGTLKIRFKTNGQEDGKGFLAKYYFERVQRPTQAPTARNKPVFRSSHYLTGDSGTFASPGYPNKYDDNVDSTWLIETDPFKKIKLNFDTFALIPPFEKVQILVGATQSDDCKNDYVEIYDGTQRTDRRLGQFCSTHPRGIESTSNKMLVVFHSNDEITNAGFVARWNTEASLANNYKYDICGLRTVKFTGDQIEVHSPNFDGFASYPPNKRCILQLSSLPDTVFNVDITKFSLQHSSPACSDYLSIRDGDSGNANELENMCGRDPLKKKVQTTGNKIFLEFVSDGNTEDKGFSILLSSAKRPQTRVLLSSEKQCGQTLIGRRGTISNPTSLSSSSTSSVCVWGVKTSPGSQVHIRFDILNLSDNCDSSYILLREGEDSNSPVLQKLCGYKNNIRLTARANKLWIEYKTRNDDIGQFVMHWSEDGAKDFSCGGAVSGRSGYLYSPFYPKTFDDDISCLWTIMAEPNKKITLSLQDTRLGDDCTRSYAIIRDGMSSSSRSLGKICSNSNREITSSGRAMWVELKAGCNSKKSFKAFWGTVEDGKIPDGSRSVTDEKSPGISEGGAVIKADKTRPRKPTSGQKTKITITKPTYLPEVITNVFGATMITSSEGVIKSPFFPKNYPHDHVKVWILRGPKPGKVTLQFTTFDIESDSHCLYDFVEVRDGGTAASPSLGRFCGTKLPDIMKSTGDKLWIKFRSDSSTHASGFSADWQWIESTNTLPTKSLESQSNGCGGVFTSGSGVIGSPSFPDMYPNNMECVYIIKPPLAQRIKLEFNTFVLEADYKCSFDYLEIKDGSTRDSPTVAKLCQSKLPNPIVSRSGAFWIRFKSDVTTQRQGFSASWAVLDNSVQ